jgi:hypothetical protein
MLKPIESTRSAIAYDLLSRGFPARGRAHWARVFRHLEQFGGNEATAVPYGQIFEVSGKPAGVILTPASLRGGRRVINFASWYVDPAHRWKAPLMLRGLLRDKQATYTDLTPTEPVQKILPALGFLPVSRGVTVNAVPLLAVTGGKRGEVTPLSGAGPLDPAVRDLLESHEEFGCHAVALLTPDGGSVPVMFKFRLLRGLPAALLVYCGDNEALRGSLGAVARHLLRRGRLLLVLDLPVGGDAPPGYALPGKTPRFVKSHAWDPARTDYCGSELALF